MALPPRQDGRAHHRKKMGTGDSAGVNYLRETLFKPLFPDLWEMRSRL